MMEDGRQLVDFTLNPETNLQLPPPARSAVRALRLWLLQPSQCFPYLYSFASFLASIIPPSNKSCRVYKPFEIPGVLIIMTVWFSA